MPAVAITLALVRDKISERVYRNAVPPVTLGTLDYVRMAADDNIYTVAAQKVGRSALCGIGMALVFVAPMHEGDYAVGSVAVYGGEVGVP